MAIDPDVQVIVDELDRRLSALEGGGGGQNVMLVEPGDVLRKKDGTETALFGGVIFVHTP